MKSKILRSSVISFMFILLFAVCALSASAAGYVTSGDFTYYVNGNYAAVTDYNGSATSVSVPSKVGSATVIQIGDNAFSTQKQIKSITFPSTILTIGKAAFNECTGLTKVVLPSKLKTIGEGAFWYCSNLEAIYIPPSVTAIAANTFTGCKNLTAYVIPGSYAEKYIKANSTVTLGYRYATSVKLAASSAKMAAGSSLQIKYAVYPQNVYNSKVLFNSSNTSVATVSTTGFVTAKSCGTTVLTVTTADGSKKTAKATLTVVPAKVTGVSQSGSDLSGYTITWNKSQGATDYGVYQYNEANGKWVLIKKTSSLSYTVTGLHAGTYSYYRILPYTVINGQYYTGAASDYIKAYVLTPGKVSNVKAKSSNNAVQLSWTKAPNATGYQIYQRNEHTGAYTYIGKTQNLTTTIKNLKPNTKYIFAIRAFMFYEGKTVVSKEFVDNITVYTTPDKVSSFSVDLKSVTPTSARLTWDKLSGITGYELYRYDEKASQKYSLIARLPLDSITGYTVDGLKKGENTNYVIRAYIDDSEVTMFGPLSPVVTVYTSTLPDTHEKAFNSFIEAFNASKSAGDDFYLIKTTEVSNLSGSYTEDCQDILNTIAHTNVSKHYFENGLESSTALPVGSYIQPYNLPSQLEFSSLKSCDYKLDGNGYKITVVLSEEQHPASVNSQIAPVIDWGVIGGQHKGFAIKYCLYEGTVIEAKVNNGKIDDMTITMPINFAFTVGGTEYAFSETITHSYIFGW